MSLQTASLSLPQGILPVDLPAELAHAITLADDYRATRALWIACFAIILYDWGLTLNEEIKYLRKHGIGRSKALFIVNRYWPIVNLLYTNTVMATPGVPDGPSLDVFLWLTSVVESCRFFRYSFAFFAIPMHTTIGAILILRIYAMYARNRKLLWTLLSLLLAEIITELIIILPLLAKMSTLILPPGFTGCIPQMSSTYTWAYWVPMATFESALFLLAAVKSVQVARSESNTPRVLGVLLRDSVLYFGGVIAVILTNLIIWASVRKSLFNVAIAYVLPSSAVLLSTAAHSILGCRMLLNIHEAAQSTFTGSGHASEFFANFAARHELEEPDIPLRPTKGITSHGASGGYDSECDGMTRAGGSHDIDPDSPYI